MKFKLKLLIVAILSTAILAGCSSKPTTDNSLADLKEKKELIIGLDDNFPPMGFRDDKGEIVGFDIDMAKEVGKRLGVKVTFKPVEWDGIILSLNNKDIDVIWNGLTITDKRKEQIAFSKVYLQNKQIIVVRSDSTIKNKTNLKDTKVGLQLGSSSETALAKDSSLTDSLKEVKKYSNNTEALLDLNAKRIDAVVVDEVVGRYYVSKKPNDYKVLDDNLGVEDYGVGIRKNDTSLTSEIDKLLEEMKKDGTSNTISQKWFGKDITFKE
ncbi:amino acid ABC transporter substrate-binding protein [Clostridium lacusfryxellense]|uniref:amino acid ABC transporter substrate-binding protein n=1 Tax=Clostridium lacusfryxellense TaxID=205328 RepID=UPI001C0D6EBE|nr:amino acid ABC transporter substrate-binding protein [Clostridium lacusfryxellense]MBU3111911.1 amino acid ABC transporter substrate-binding protein [Clostridium lacusfryxellense]